MLLLERESALSDLADAATAAADGAGRLVLVSGEAGAGKTSLVRAFAAALGDEVTLRWGACDNLRTPRPLGPFLDIAGTSGALPPARADRFAWLSDLLAGPRPTVAIVEDAHWADEATLDAVSFLGRRIAGLPALLVVTYRADELAPGHPLLTVVGELATTRPLRVHVRPLSAAAVEELARPYDVDAAELHARTGGNAFFVTECLAGAADDVPGTVRDAVLSRVSRLSAVARDALETTAVIPGPAELWLLDALGVAAVAVDDAVAAGALVMERGRVAFRHELARLAVLDTVLPGRLRSLHAALSAALAHPPYGDVDHARRAHHAGEGGDVDGVLESAPLAARAAAAVGARREAVAHLERLLRYEHRLSYEQRIAHRSEIAQLLTALGQHEDAIAAYDDAADLARDAGDDARRGELLARVLTPLSMAGLLPRALTAVTESVTLLENGDPSAALALAYAQRCTWHMLARELPAAEPWGRRAIDLARQLDDTETLAYALIQSGVALWMSGDEAGYQRLLDGVEVARRHNHAALVAQGLSQIGSGGGEIRRYVEAIAALRECVDFTDRLELASRGLYASAWLARCDLEQGRWWEAAARIDAVLASPRCEGIARMTALTDLGRLRARRGDPQVWEALDESLARARPTAHLQRLWPIAVARAEAGWLEGDIAPHAPLLREVHARAVDLDFPWAVGALELWLTRAGSPAGGTARLAEPYALHLAGDHAAAAAAWQALGCGYEAADALSDSADEAQLRTALATFTELGAIASARRLAARMREAGLRVPRGPSTATRANPSGLTDREVEVLRLVAAGCSNAEIAAQLYISVKTAGHHVSHLLAKLGARTRAEAVTAAVTAGVDVAAGAPR